MEKKKPHYSLRDIKAVVAARGLACFTLTARAGFRRMGLQVADALATIATLDTRNFYKSMTTHADHRAWQDVYYAEIPGKKTAYIKFTLTLCEGRVVIQFKEK
ncbi:hypothetical protein AGMMS49543_18530 [Betaproteobacteria bacterium]|nr:hypothetical protein AGMMS49543_18530 [Betaproteobacteria bacterium]GHU22168.1 hypothetical protein AGMMS50243_21230 [Betaproteobacteria bacterium]